MDSSIVRVDWDESGIGQGDDFLRFALLAALLRKYIPEGSVLDIGCDTGQLKGLLGNAIYTGIDPRTEAIETARKQFPGSSFVCARAEDWTPSQKFDAIVFNESLYYLSDFAGALTKFHQSLRGGGLLAISIYKHPRWLSPNSKALKVTRLFVTDFYRTLHDFEITSGGASWNIFVGRKLAESARGDRRQSS